ncbi:MAG: ABC transporter ATP-binding protein [Ancalomicrobiaceae bacterium]|nr:ABC transporter ATP-binding protein [Ancalomicrobiaceae bacterium]
MSDQPAPAPLLDIADLIVSYADHSARRTVVHGVSLIVKPGEVVALVGESGSGKTTIAQSVIGLLPANGRIETGRIRLNGTDITRWSERRLDTIRGSQISLIPQDPGSSLNPVMTIGAQVGEIFRLHGERDERTIRARVIELLGHVGLSDPALRAAQYPHELSGGMKQRVLIAIAVALKPQLIIADEPTSALDVTVQRRILDLIDDLRRETGTALLLVTHDLGIAADRADRLIVLQHGHIQETGATGAVLARPASPYTARLIADAPALSGTMPARPQPTTAVAADSPGAASDLVVVERLVRDFPLRSGETLRAVDDVSFRIAAGTTHAIVGESGSGKTTTIRIVVGFERPTAGRVVVDGIDVSTLKGEDLRRFRKSIQLVYQNPFSSLDPKQDVFTIIEEPLLNFEPLAKPVRRERVHDILDRVHLPRTVLGRLPQALSGGQRQRVAIARALILSPKVLVLDEAVSALDVSVQAQILALLNELQRELGLTYLFVSHDLAVVRQIADTVSVMKDGRLIESGAIEHVFHCPVDAYTRDLLAAIPGQGNGASPP